MNTGQFAESPCDKVRRQLDDRAIGPLDASADQEVLQHLANCPACAEGWEARTRLRTRLKNAVEHQPVPVELRVKIRERIQERESRVWWRAGWPRLALATAATLALCVGVWLSRPAEPLPALADRPAQDAYIRRVSTTVANVLRLGLGDHIHCSVFRKYPQDPPTTAQMEEKLGPEFKGVLPVVRTAVPDGYRIIMAHHCGYAGRKYTHVTLQRGSDLLSLVIARKNPGESLAGLSPSLNPSGIPVYQSAAQMYEVASFEAGDYLAFVVSDLRGKANLQIAANLAPALHEFLTKIPA